MSIGRRTARFLSESNQVTEGATWMEESAGQALTHDTGY